MNAAVLKCPVCAGEMKKKRSVCPWCGSWLEYSGGAPAAMLDEQFGGKTEETAPTEPEPDFKPDDAAVRRWNRLNYAFYFGAITAEILTMLLTMYFWSAVVVIVWAVFALAAPIVIAAIRPKGYTDKGGKKPLPKPLLCIGLIFFEIVIFIALLFIAPAVYSFIAL